MIRSLMPDELPWFVSRAVAYLGHSDPHGLSRRLTPRLREVAGDAARCFVHVDGRGRPTAGVYVRAPTKDDDDHTLTLASPWHRDDPEGLQRLLTSLLQRFPHEAAVAPLHAVPAERVTELAGTFGRLGFRRDELRRVRFELADVSPLGLPLVLESWTPHSDRAFRQLYQRAEACSVSDRFWAFLKRRHGSFRPELWFMARPALDQQPVGYACYGSRRRGLDAVYVMNGVGVLQQYRDSSEMLLRLLLSTLNELAGFSPLGAVVSELSTSDPKLIAILMSLGFSAAERYPILLQLPL